MKLSPWLALGALLGLGSVLAWFSPGSSAWLDWQPQLVWAEPWRACSAVFVHWSQQHLLANLGACAVVSWFGWAARVPPRAAQAFALAWPLTQWGLLIKPELLHFGGLSGYLHAGVAVVLVELVFGPASTPRQRRVGLAVSLGLVIKLWSEEPLGPPMRVISGWDIAVAPLSHLTGALAGAFTAGLLLLLSSARPR
ncbi:rhombosortase [Paucibacter sp. KBW04]|uniref:rhombosortase n=1 Tax=Paucibacter sp. KBW04 TaxID=2153361 RepID=UPI000F55F1D7|nr:rhombosortase [Paucibacter sp. KBW04]RQO54722.1 rhombosortase [Paucibacter sp. KBW04]